jgi:hypothetical protein
MGHDNRKEFAKRDVIIQREVLPDGKFFAQKISLTLTPTGTVI